MTAFIVVKDSPQVMTNLSAIEALKGISLIWDKDTGELDERTTQTEIWCSETNDRSAATKVATVNGDNWTDFNVTAGDTVYYWVRGKDIEGRTGDWNSGSTAGLAATGALTLTVDIGISAVTTFDNTTEQANETITAAYGTYQLFTTNQFVVADIPVGDQFIECSWFEVYGALVNDFPNPLVNDNLTVDLELELYNISDSVSHWAISNMKLYQYTLKYNSGGSNLYMQTDLTDGSTNFVRVFDDLLPNKTYEMRLSLKRDRNRADQTITYTSFLRSLTMKAFKR